MALRLSFFSNICHGLECHAFLWPTALTMPTLCTMAVPTGCFSIFHSCLRQNRHQNIWISSETGHLTFSQGLFFSPSYMPTNFVAVTCHYPLINFPSLCLLFFLHFLTKIVSWRSVGNYLETAIKSWISNQWKRAEHLSNNSRKSLYSMRFYSGARQQVLLCGASLKVHLPS